MLLTDRRAAGRGQPMPGHLPGAQLPVDVHHDQLLPVGARPHPLIDQLVRDRVLRAADADPQNSKTLLRLARIYTGLGRPEEAMITFGRISPPPSAKDIAPAKRTSRCLLVQIM